MLFILLWERDRAENIMIESTTKNKEYQTARLFATLGILTIIAVLLFKVVLFGPTQAQSVRVPAEISSQPE